MSPEVLARKLERLAAYLAVLERHKGRTADQVRNEPYEVERLLELLVQVAVDLVAHLVVEQGSSPASYREVFREAGRVGVIPTDLATRLADAAGLRNILVHMYEDIDYQIVADSIGRTLQDFRALLETLSRRLDD